MWTNNESKIINMIKNHQKNMKNPALEILQCENSPKLIYNNLMEFLFLYPQRAVNDILTNVFSAHLLLIEPFMTGDVLVVYYNTPLKDLYRRNLQEQLNMFITAINLMNDCKNKIIGHASEAKALRKSGINKKENITYTDTDISLIAAILIILELKIKQDPINKLILGLNEDLSENLIKLLKQYTYLYDIYNTNNKQLNKTQLIDLIRKVYGGGTLTTEEEEFKQMLILK